MKKARKIFAVLMACAMVLSMFAMTASAADDKTYTPAYEQGVTPNVVNTLLKDSGILINGELLNKIINPALSNDDLIKTIYGAYPALAGVVPEAGTLQYYKDHFGALFADMSTDPVTADSIAAYLKDKSLGVKDPDSFFSALKTALKPLLSATLTMNLGGTIYPLGTIPDVLLTELCKTSFNPILTGLGWDEVKIEFTSEAVDDKGMVVDYDAYTSQLCDALANLLDYVRVDTLGKIALAVRSLAKSENRVLVTTGISLLVEGFVPGGMLGGLLNIEAILPAPYVDLLVLLDDSKNALKDPAVGNGKEAYDFTKLLNAILQLDFLTDSENPEQGMPIGLVLSDINWANLTNLNADQLDTDTFMVLYHYLFGNLFKNPDNLDTVTKLVASVLPDVAPLLKGFASMNENLLLKTVAPMLHGVANPQTTATDEGTGITVSTAFPLDNRLSVLVEHITQGDAFTAAEAALKEIAEQWSMYGITLADQKGKYQADGSVSVSIPVPAGFDSARTVIYKLGEGDVLEEVFATLNDDGVLSFSTTALGTFVIAEKAKAAEPVEPTVPENPTNPENPTQPDFPSVPPTTPESNLPKTGDTVLPAVLLLSVAAGCALYLSRKKDT